MVFSSVQFLFVFFPLVLAFYFLSPMRWKNGVLLAFSLVFYAWGGVGYTLLIVLSILGNYLLGLVMERHDNDPCARKIALAAGVFFNLGLLGYFKYYDFFVSSLISAGVTALSVKNIALPIGISFYTFQAMSYLIDLYRRKIRVQHNLFDFALYISLFPQLIAGPIVRYQDLESALPAGCHPTTLDGFCFGIKRFILGLGKKVIFANQLGAYYAVIQSASPTLLPWPVLVLGGLLYPLQLYYDFSGYSDMAIGLGRMFGFTFPENFNYPYLARSIGEYWRRWHITLSTWFREYVYIPLGGSRSGTLRTCCNLFFVFLLTGLWHGAAWQYVVFGAYMGVILVAERLFLRRVLEAIPRIFGHLYTLALLFIGLVIFGSNGLWAGLQTLFGIFTRQAGSPAYQFSQFVDARLYAVLLPAVLLCGPAQALCPPLKKLLEREDDVSLPGMVFLFAVLLFSVMRITAGSYNPFIYFRF